MIRLVLVLLCLAGPLRAEGFRVHAGHGGPVMGLAVAADGRLATASFDNSVGLWADGAPRWLDGHEAAVNRVMFLPDGRLVSGSDDFTVRIWDVAAGTGRVLGRHAGKVMGLALAPGGDRVASASWDGSVALWPLEGGAPLRLAGHDGAVNDVAFGPDGRLLSAGADGTVRLWDPATGAELRTLVRHGFGINRLLIGPGWLAYGAVDGGTRLVDPSTGAALADYTAERKPILALAGHGALLAVGDGEGHIMIVDTAAGAVLHDFRAVARGPVWALAFGPAGKRIHAAGLDPVVQSWPLSGLDGAETYAAAEPGFLRAPETMGNGERQFMRKCSICHSLTPGSARRAGPTLHGLFGRRSGRVSDYAYSERLARGDIVWHEATIDALFDEGPDHFVPGSKMPMQRIGAAGDRADLIAYLKHATRATETRP